MTAAPLSTGVEGERPWGTPPRASHPVARRAYVATPVVAERLRLVLKLAFIAVRLVERPQGLGGLDRQARRSATPSLFLAAASL
jgi:hypothetical protein